MRALILSLVVLFAFASFADAGHHRRANRVLRRSRCRCECKPAAPAKDAPKPDAKKTSTLPTCQGGVCTVS